MGSVGGSKHEDKSFDRILGIGIPDLLILIFFIRQDQIINLVECWVVVFIP